MIGIIEMYSFLFVYRDYHKKNKNIDKMFEHSKIINIISSTIYEKMFDYSFLTPIPLLNKSTMFM